MKRIGVSLLAAALLIFLLLQCPGKVTNQPESQGAMTVTRVIDGSSLLLSDAREVRLIGVDTPEITDHARNVRNAAMLGVDPVRYESYALKAKGFLTNLTAGKPVRTEIDPVNEMLNHHDRQGRFLTYLYAGDVFVNAEIIRQGYGVTYRKFQFRFKDKFLGLEQEAKENYRGLWKFRTPVHPSEIDQALRQMDEVRQITDQKR